MKKMMIAAVAMACLMTCSAYAAESLTFEDLNSTDTFALEVHRVLRLSPDYSSAERHYSVQQGCATDCEYGYFILENQLESLGSVWKVDLSTGEVVQQAFELPLDHGNDMTYNPNTGLLIVANNKPNYSRLTFIDPETLEVAGTHQLDQSIYAIAYSESRDQYVIGLSSGYNFAILDGDFNEIAFFSGENTGLVRQGVACDDRYIYFPQSSDGENPNAVMVYDWEGNFVNRLAIRGSFQEVESAFFVEDELYLAFNAGGSYVYTAELIRE